MGLQKTLNFIEIKGKKSLSPLENSERRIRMERLGYLWNYIFLKIQIQISVEYIYFNFF